MKITKTPIAGAFIIMMLLSVGCGSATAPPVDLPAPITGRIDVSSPDGDGNVTVTGDEEAVTGGQIVMVVNENEAGAVSWMILNLIVPSAYAQTFPSICDDAGHACTESADDGSFQVIIPAAVGDVLVIGLIDSEGNRISDTISLTVPESGTPEPDANCEGMAVSGAIVDIKIAPTSGIPVMLKQGSDTTTNQLIIGETSPTTVSITGCYAHSLAFYGSTVGDSIAVTSKDDKVLWAGRFVDGEVLDSRSFTLDYEPMHIVYVNLSSQPTVAIRKTSNTVRLARISTSEGTIQSEMQIILSSSGIEEVSGVTRSTVLDVIPMNLPTGEYLGMAVVDDGSNTNSYLVLFQAEGTGPTRKGAWSRLEISLFNAGNPLASIVDGILYKKNVGTDEYVLEIAIIDTEGGNNLLQKYKVMRSTVSVPTQLYYLDILATVELVDPLFIMKRTPVGGPLDLIVRGRLDMTGHVGLMTNADGQLLENLLGWDYDIEILGDLAAGHDIVAIDALPSMNLFYGADATAEAIIDGSSLVPW